MLVCAGTIRGPTVGVSSVPVKDGSQLGACSGGLRQVTMPSSTSIQQERVEKQLHRQSKSHKRPEEDEDRLSPLQRLDNKDLKVSKNSMLLLIDHVGSNMKSDGNVKVWCNPACSLTALYVQVRIGDVKFVEPNVVLSVGTNQIADFNRKVVIAQAIALLQAIKDKTNANVWMLGLIP